MEASIRMVAEKRLTPYELAEGMQKYLDELKKHPDKEECRQSLIRSGVLDENGHLKKQICTGGYYVGN